MSSAHLIIGGDGLIGRNLFSAIMSTGCPVLRTSRRSGSIDKTIWFDLASPPESLLEQLKRNDWPGHLPATAYLTAGVAGFERCAQDPKATKWVNVHQTTELARCLAEHGMFQVFPSSDAVFGSKQAVAYESILPHPESEYGRQKAMTEAALMEIAEPPKYPGIAVVRLTKVLSADTPLIDKWLQALARGESIEAFDDVFFAPISIQHCVRTLMTIGAERYSGISHVMGAEGISYYEFARILADRWVGTERQVKPVSSGVRMKRNLGRRGKAPVLSTCRAKEVGLRFSQPVIEVVADLIS